MTHTNVLKIFGSYFPNYSGENIAMWFTNGRNSIRVRLTNGQELIFTYDSQTDWKLETTDSFLERLKQLKGEKKQ